MNRWIGSMVAGGLLLAGCAGVEPAAVHMYGGDPSSPGAAPAPFEPPPDVPAAEGEPGSEAVEPTAEPLDGHAGHGPGQTAPEEAEAPPPPEPPRGHAGHGEHAEVPPEGAETVYACPMHPEMRSPTAGECPKCGMRLQKREVEE